MTGRKEISITDYAKELGISRQYIGRLVKKNRLPKGIAKIKRISKGCIVLVRE